MSRIPAQWRPRVPMKRIVCHWTAGSHTANSTDKKAYHILIEGDGKVIKGVPSIADNSGKLSDNYAAHTLNCNTDSIGVALCAMAGAVESPFKPGSYPINEVQWGAFIDVVAELTEFYSIEVTPKTVLFHAEVQKNLGIAQKNKWDVSRLVFNGGAVGASVVGDLMRKEVSKLRDTGSVVTLDPIPTGGIAVAISDALTCSIRNGQMTGKIPKGTSVEVIAVDGQAMQVETPAGYLVWTDRVHFKMVDGPQTETDLQPHPSRETIAQIRELLDRLEGSLD